jgi:tetratricopeptide (TPR) repeat protein
MFNRKQYIITIVALAVLVVGASVASVGFQLFDPIFIILGASLGYLYLKYRVSGPLQLFSTKFNMYVDYDLDLVSALALCKEHLDNAPVSSVAEVYRWYSGMAHYYSGDYESAIKTLNQVELKRMNPVYQVLIFVFIAYSAYELGDMDLFATQIERIEGVKSRIPGKYQGFVTNYTEILTGIQNKNVATDLYKDMIEKHFSREDGYISTKLIYNYRLADYYDLIGDPLEKDKCFAFVIANGKEHHTALQAKKRFTNLVNVEDFVYDIEAERERKLSESAQELKAIEDEPKDDKEE